VHASESNTVTLYPVADSWVRDKAPSNNYGDKRILEVYNWKPEGDGGSTSNAYLMFYLAEIPKNITIESANLTVYISDLDATLIGEIHYCPNSSWKEFEINWKNAPDFNEDYVDSMVLNGSKELYSFDVTEDLNEVIDKEQNKITFVLTAKEMQSLRGFSITSKEGGSREQIPKLEIIYSFGKKAVEKTTSNNQTVTKNETHTEKTYSPVITKSETKTQPTEKTTSTPEVKITETVNQSSLDENYFTILFGKFDLITIFSIIALLGIIAIGILTKFVIKPKFSLNGLFHTKSKKEISASKSLEITNCDDCGERLRPLKFSNKNICPNCQKVYNRNQTRS
jgi:hypothetical protein